MGFLLKMMKKIRKWQHRALNAIVSKNKNIGLGERAELFVRSFEHQLSSGSRILDIGGGWGFYREPLTRRGHQHVVLDVVNPGLQKAPVVLYPGQRIPFGDKSFDVSLFVTVLHHIHDIDQVLDEARRVTKDKIIIVEDLYQHALGRWWTVLRDQIYNFEFFGHPKNFKTKQAWIKFFEEKHFLFKEEIEIRTKLAGLGILNGVLTFEV